MKIRDFLAVPFWSLALLCDYLAVSIGGKWTAAMIEDQRKELGKL